MGTHAKFHKSDPMEKDMKSGYACQDLMGRSESAIATKSLKRCSCPGTSSRNTTKQDSPVNIRTSLPKCYSSYTCPRFADSRTTLGFVIHCVAGWGKIWNGEPKYLWNYIGANSHRGLPSLSPFVRDICKIPHMKTL